MTDEELTTDDYGLIAEGKYNVECEECSFETTKNGKKHVKMKLRILGPTQKNRVVFQSFWIFAESNAGRNINKKKLAAFVEQNGYSKDEMRELDLSAFVGMRAGAKIKISKSEGYDDRNEVAHFIKMIDEMSVDTHSATPQVPSVQASEVKNHAPTFEASEDIPFN